MYKRKIKLNTPEDVAHFVNICSKYSCDINIYDGRSVIDAKSLVGVFAISQGKEIEVEINSSDEDTVVGFLDSIRKYEVNWIWN